MPDKNLVISVSRSGFTLLISALIEIQKATGLSQISNRELVLKSFIDRASPYIVSKYKQAFTDFGWSNDLIFSGEFDSLVGGSKWLNPKNSDLACFWKYFGIRGKGEFLLKVSHPKQVLDYYQIVHSHVNPKTWLEDPYYSNYRKFTSIRNPIAIINSYCFAINSITSEYIQRFCPNADEIQIRQKIALYKMTDLNFFSSFINFLTSYFENFIPVKDEYVSIKWEDLIARPVTTIQYLAEHLERPISSEIAEEIWQFLGHRNLSRSHQYNYRYNHHKDSRIIGNWKKGLVNEHLELLEQSNFNHYLTALGYDPIQKLDPDEYSPFQKLVSRYIQRQEVYKSKKDPNLYVFGFSKNNIDPSHFNFKSYEQKQWTQIERCSIPDNSPIVETVSGLAEEFCNSVNPILEEIITTEFSRKAETQKFMYSLNKRLKDLFRDQPQYASELRLENMKF